MIYRHEQKHRITYADMLIIRQRMHAVAKCDSHAINGSYHIRSLYFDTPSDRALREKTDGVNFREKFRVRYYNLDTSLIHLEKKSKLNGLGNKQIAVLTEEEAKAIAEGNTSWMAESDRPLVRELYAKMNTQHLLPKTIVDYMREPFVYPSGNVRVTLDYNIRTGLCGTDFLNPHCITVPVPDNPIILEIKWDEFLPSIIRDAVQLENCRTEAFSKYAACRVYG